MAITEFMTISQLILICRWVFPFVIQSSGYYIYVSVTIPGGCVQDFPKKDEPNVAVMIRLLEVPLVPLTIPLRLIKARGSLGYNPIIIDLRVY